MEVISDFLLAQNDIEKINQYLDEFEAKCGQPDTIREDTINKATALLDIDFSNFRKTSEECATDALILSTYVHNLQRVINREKGIVLWAKERIKKVIGPLMKHQNAYHWEERQMCAISSDALASRLFKIKVDAELRLTRIESLYFSVKNIADRLSDLHKTLRNRQ